MDSVASDGDIIADIKKSKINKSGHESYKKANNHTAQGKLVNKPDRNNYDVKLTYYYKYYSYTMIIYKTYKNLMQLSQNLE